MLIRLLLSLFRKLPYLRQGRRIARQGSCCSLVSQGYSDEFSRVNFKPKANGCGKIGCEDLLQCFLQEPQFTFSGTTGTLKKSPGKHF